MESNKKLLDHIDNILNRKASGENTVLTICIRLQSYWKYILCSIPPKLNMPRKYIEALSTKFFFDHIDTIYPKNGFTCKPEEKFEWPIPLCPSEVFGKKSIPENCRLENFFKLLKVADVLDCKVLGIQHSEMCLIVVHKHGSNRLLEDLNIKLLLPQTAQELAFLEGQTLSNNDFLRVAVSEIIQVAENGKVIKVTLDKTVLHDPNNSIKLGRISETDLPIYVRDPCSIDTFKTMKDYLDSQYGFHSPKYISDVLACFGFNPKGVYSFIKPVTDMNDEDCQSMTVKVENMKNDFQKHKKEHKINEVEKHCLKALVHLTELRCSEALTEINNAVKEDPQCCRAYEIRAEIYEKMEGLTGKQCMYNLAKVYSLDKDNMKNRERLAQVMSLAANRHLKNKAYLLSRTLAERCLVVNPHQKGALDVLRYLRKHHSVEAFGEKDPKEVEETVPIKKIKQEPA